MVLHLPKLEKLCRFCKCLLTEEKQNRTKQSVCLVLQLQYPDTFGDLDLDKEDPQVFPPYMCSKCYKKCTNWKTGYDRHKTKMRKKSASEPFVTNIAMIGEDEISTGLVCTEDHDCLVCSLVLPAEQLVGPSPSKILQISEVATVSPRDKSDPKIKKSALRPTAGLVSVKLDFQKGHRRPSGEIEMQEPETIKIFTETKRLKSFPIENCVESDQARLLMCKLCKRFPSKPVISTICGHIFCAQCYHNFKSAVPTTICPGSVGDNCGKVVTPDH